MYNTIIFDVDGTIIDTEKAVLSSLQKLLMTDYNLHYECKDLHFALGIPGADALKQMGILDVEQACERWNHFMKEYFHTVAIFEGMTMVLKALSEQNIKTGIVTSKTKEELLNDFVPFGLMNYLSYAICADDTVEHKPTPEPILKFLEFANVCPDQAVYIGDTRYDMECAQAAGVDFALALWGSKNPALEAKYKLDHPKSILRLLQKV